jgi:stearoyl-CoA desaturase (delta-9 desaturase)
MLIYTILTIHLACVLASLYMHRYLIHRQFYVHPRAETVMKIMYWILFDVVTREFVVQHRKHHEFSDSNNDPHTPRFGFWTLLMCCLVPSFFRSYKITVTESECVRYGAETFTDTFIDRHPRLGVVLLLLINTVLFGWYGIAIWIIHLFVVNFLTITTITVFGHSIGYSNFNFGDYTRNVVPIGILCVGEELHNNHHKDSRQCNMAVNKNEFDLGFFYLQVLSKLNLIQFKDRNRNVL